MLRILHLPAAYPPLKVVDGVIRHGINGVLLPRSLIDMLWFVC